MDDYSFNLLFSLPSRPSAPLTVRVGGEEVRGMDVLVITTWGEKFQSIKHSPRLYIRSMPKVEIRNIKEALLEASIRLNHWRPAFPNPTPWYEVMQCPHCLRRIKTLRVPEYLSGFSDPLHMYCWRHTVPSMLEMYTILDNKERKVIISSDAVTYYTCSNKHDVAVKITKEKAIAVVDGKLKFTYKNHVNCYPLTSTYAKIAEVVEAQLSALLEVLENLEVFMAFSDNGIVYKTASEDRPIFMEVVQ